MTFTTLANVPVVTLSANPTSGTANVVNPTLTWTTTNSPTSCTASGDWSGSKNTAGGSESQGILTTVKTYSYSLVCANAGGNSNTATATVTVSAAVLPTVTTNPSCTNITKNSLTSGGDVTADGGASVTAKGVAINSAPNPTTSNNTASGGSGLGSFTAGPFTSLAASTTYHLRAYATNSAGTAYGADVTCTTINVPTVTTTSPITNITQTTATGGGTVTSDGGATVTV
ncbi:MAG: hypothetical protein UV76_C0017G0001, partial [Candidatus Nomurabacteria bacterium GW2011_GWA2_43_15]